MKALLIANRGEIARRIMRTARRMGIRTIAVYSDADHDALHVREADTAVCIGGAPPRESYLNIAAIIEAAKRTGADAVHPGYGFLAENADFAQAVIDAGLTWVGPPPAVIRAMGDKIEAKCIARNAGVPTIPGVEPEDQGNPSLAATAKALGFPLMIKAAAGGGGRGMRLVSSEAELAAALDAARSEAEHAFGDGRLLLERALTNARHIELQIFADQHDNVIHLGERDCSVQRRHQKLIEESPAAGLGEETRQSMGKAALEVARACGYVNAGTVEFLYQDGEFYFLEMNTRLQVEHCVTEMVTGIDLVAEQVRVAAGEALSFTQDSIERRGHAIECRINAEDPARNFQPAPGLITRFERPDGFGVRTDAGYAAGLAVPQYYDNLMAKLVVWGPDRESARRRMLRALTEFRIEGVRSTIPAHVALLSHPDFVEARHSTRWLEEEVDPATLVPAASEAAPAGPEEGGEALVARTVPVEVNGRRFDVKVWLPEADEGGPASAPATRPRGRSHSAGSGGAPAGSDMVAAPMQGTIVKTLVSVGDRVEVGQAVIVLEAMKMENHVNAERAGTVSEVRVAPGDTVGTGDVLVVIS